MKRIEYLRCPVCGKLSLLANFQVHRLGGRHRLEIMVQEISSKGRAKIRNKWYSGKISRKKRQELRAVFGDILSHVLDDLMWDGTMSGGKVKEEEWKDDEIFEAEPEDEIFEVEPDEIFEVEAEDEIFEVEAEDDEIFFIEDRDEETFKVSVS